jgi:SAM-dependent methyltransferase
MSRNPGTGPTVPAAFVAWWRQGVAYHGVGPTLRRLLAEIWDFLRESTPSHQRRRYGDAEYDWDYRVNTTSATVGFRERLIGVFHSAYQPTDPAAFHEMLTALPVDPSRFVFVDLGSGKGRTLLMASEYPFQRIMGVEFLPALHRVAQDNIFRYKNENQRCFAMESVLGEAQNFVFPEEPLVLYLFNPFPESVLKQVLGNLERSLRENPRPALVLYHNPLLEYVLYESPVLSKISSNAQYALYISHR